MKKFILSVVAVSIIGVGSAIAGGGVHWGYSGHEGPDHWGELSEKFKTCGSGKNQSPINIKDSVKAELEPISFNYKTSPTEILNNGHTVQINIASGSSITAGGKTFELKQYHFHSPSENQINGKSFPMEAHLVHADKAGNLAVVGVMFEEGNENKEIAQLWHKIPKRTDKPVPLSGEAKNVSQLLPKNKSYYRFNGSLTTPPCSEGVRWFVLKKPVTASKTQVSEFLHIMHHPNNRPIQPSNARVVLK